GRGFGDDPRQPCVIAEGAPNAVGSFAPIPAAFASRRRRLGGLSGKKLAAAVVEIPPRFDWSYFQSAPVDQRLELLTAEEWIWLEGMHAEHRHFRTRLPGAQVAARCYSPGAGVPEVIPLRAE